MTDIATEAQVSIVVNSLAKLAEKTNDLAILDLLMDTLNVIARQRLELDEAVGALRLAVEIVEKEFGHGVDNGYWPTIAPTLIKLRTVLSHHPESK